MKPTFQVEESDSVSWLRSLPEESVDLVVTDPPYESLEKHRAIGTTTRLKHSKASSNDWFTIFPNARFPELFAEVYRVLKRNAHFYLFCDPGDDVRRQADRRGGGLQVLEADDLGQAEDRHGLPLPRALRVHAVLREGQAAS